MEKYTLRFKSKTLEKEYQDYIRKINVPIFMQLSYTYILVISTPSLIISLVNTQINETLYAAFTFLCLSICIILLKKLPQFYNFYINILQIGTTTIFCLILVLEGPRMDTSDPYVLFYYSGSILQIQLTLFFLCENFILAVIQIMATLIVFVIITWTREIYAFKFTYIIYYFFIVFFFYKTYAQKKEAFSLRQSEKQWAKVVKYGLSTSIITVKYNEKQNFIALDIVNQHAQNMLQVDSNDSFKQFSRAIKVFPVYKESEKDDVSSSLENKIIEYLKAQIENHRKERTSLKEKAKELHFKTLGKEAPSVISDMFAQRQNTLLLYSTYQRTEYEDPKKYRIKLSSYLHQNCYHCCIELDEEKDIQKLKILQLAKNNIEQRFYVTCLKMGERLSKIESFITNKQQIISNIRLAQIQLQNIHDHVRQIRRQFSNADPRTVTDLTLGEVVHRVQESFYQATESKYFKFSYENCDKNTVLKTLNARFSQVLHNFIENSIRATQIMKSQFKQSKHSDVNRKLSNILASFRFSKQKSTTFKSSSNQASSPMEEDENQGANLLTGSTRKKQKNVTHHYYQPDVSKTKRSVNMMKSQICQTFFKKPARDMRESVKDSILDSQMRQSVCQLRDTGINGSESQHNLSTIIKSQKIKIKFTLLEGQNSSSSILKVSISDNGISMQQQKLLTIMKEIGNLEKDDKYAQFTYLGWKVNQSLIGRLGPYHDFFAQSCSPNGFEVHFYIYQNLKITMDQNSFVPFENKLFNDELQISKTRYYSTFSKQILANAQKIQMDFSEDEVDDEIQSEEDSNLHSGSEKLEEKLQDFKIAEQNSEILKSSTQIFADQLTINRVYSTTQYKVSIPTVKKLSNNNLQVQHINSGDDTTRPILPSNELEYYSAIFS